MSEIVHVLAPAKVNLFLGVGGIREDGYHTVDAVFHELALADEVQVALSDRLSVACQPDVGVVQEDNLAAVAARAFGREFGVEPDVSIFVRKRIPHGAGLGGGSSDAAAVIRAMAALWGFEATDRRCVAAARSVGADVPFFLVGGAALMTGRGDELVRVLPASGACAVIVRPPEPVSTAEAYRAFDRSPVPAGEADLVVAALEHADDVALGAALDNNFEPISTRLVPAVGDALAWVGSRAGVYGAVMAGSGSAVLALTEDEGVAESIAAGAEAKGWWGMPTRLVAAPAVEEGYA